jgi:hypothetical protein
MSVNHFTLYFIGLLDDTFYETCLPVTLNVLNAFMYTNMYEVQAHRMFP